MSSDAANLRNIAFVGHPSAGKTTLIDALAHALAVSDRKGSVADKTSICDTEPEEQERQHTLTLSAVHAEERGVRWNLIDTPGYPEFAADAQSAMFACELTLGVVSAASGVTYNLRHKMAAAAGMKRGRALLVTHLDGEHVDWDELEERLRSALGETCVPVLTPNASGTAFSSVGALAEAWRKALFDRVMDACDDEAVVMRYLENETLGEDELRSHLPHAIAKGALVPILVCNPASGVGIEEVLSWLAIYAPSPVTRALFAREGQDLPPDPKAAPLGIVFNVRSDAHVGKVCLARMVQGVLRVADPVGEGKGEKVGGLFHAVGGKRRDAIELASAGDIVAFTKVEHVGWGKTFTVGGAAPALAPPPLPSPMVPMAIAPKSRADEQKIGQALHKIEAEDPSFQVSHNEDTHELVVSGMSELHLQIVEQRLKRRYGVEIVMSLPRIAYRETVTRASEAHYRHKKQTGGRGQFGECYVRMRPGAENSGVVFKDEVVGGAIPRNLIPAVEKGVREVAAEGVLTHSKVVDVEVEVYDGKFHAVDSDEASFKKAGAGAFRDAFAKAGPVLLEPIMDLEIYVPTEHAGGIFSDLTSHRRGHVHDQQSSADGTITVIQAKAPLATLLTYSRDLKSQTAGEGSFTMKPHHYERVPAAEQSKILAAIGRKHVEEE
jgi:elongation factor G